MLRAHPVEDGAVRLDGALNEAEWFAADSLTDLRQREPHEGAPASERTVVRVLVSATALYIGVRAYDEAPRLLRASQLRRDADLSVDDNVTLLIDSFRDRRGAFVFRTNPNGARWDAQLNGFEDLNENWTGVWDVAATRDAAGWTAEFRIPFRTLRFHPGETRFGFNVERLIRRKNEDALWRSWRRTEGLLQLLRAGELSELPPLGGRRDVEIRPFVLGRETLAKREPDGVVATPGGSSAKAGADAKVGITPTLTADLTVNTDFAQVEADQQPINLTRFPLFFPEKREFFLESSGLFDFGTPERAQLFYTRRIGLRDGVPVPILAGARLYGKAGPWALGLLDARTGRGEEANDLVLRAKHDFLARSYIGGMYVQRSGPGLPAGAERGAGLDVQLPLVWGGRNIEPSFWIAGTATPGIAGTPIAWRAGTDYPNDLFDNFVSLYRIDAGFSPTLGFVRRTGIWETTGHVDFTPRPKRLGIRQLDLKLVPSWDIIADESGSLLHSRDWQTASFEWTPIGGELESGDEFALNVQRLLDAPTDGFGIFRDVTVGPGRYWWTRAELAYEMSSGRPLSLGGTFSVGGFYDGTSTELEIRATWRGGGRIILGLDATRSAVRLAAGGFDALQGVLRAEYALNTRADFLAFVQYNNDDQRADVNLRFHWTPTTGDDVYLVWDSGYSTDPSSRYRFPRPAAVAHPVDGALVIKGVHRLAF